MTTDPIDFIGRKQKFVRWTFILEANDLQNAYMAALFGNLGYQKFV
jgi:hypothetical protein